MLNFPCFQRLFPVKVDIEAWGEVMVGAVHSRILAGGARKTDPHERQKEDTTNQIFCYSIDFQNIKQFFSIKQAAKITLFAEL